MCRNIRPLFNFEPPTTEAEIRAAALQYVRKVSGSARPAIANQTAVDAAVEEIARATSRLLDNLTTHSPPKNREVERERARARAARRFSS